jgi:DNA-binding protein HU-beta
MLKGIFEQLAQDQNVPKKQAQELLTGMVERVTSHLRQGDRIRVNGLGTLEVRKREARTGRNPATGETLQIAPSKMVAFRPAKELNSSASLSRSMSIVVICHPRDWQRTGAGSCHEWTIDEDRLRPYIHLDFCGVE